MQTLSLVTFVLISLVRDRAAPFGLPSLTENHLSPQSSRCRGLVLGERGEAQVRLDNVHLGEELGSLVALDGGVDNDIVTCNTRLAPCRERSHSHCVTYQEPS
jgi:hypothetical protein